MAVNWLRGFRRIGWVLIALGGILAAFMIVDFCKEVVGFDTNLVKTNFPDDPFSPALTVKLLEFEKAQSDAVKSKESLRVVCEDPEFKRLTGRDQKRILQLNSLF